jgi:hypothetical protein
MNNEQYHHHHPREARGERRRKMNEEEKRKVEEAERKKQEAQHQKDLQQKEPEKKEKVKERKIAADLPASIIEETRNLDAVFDRVIVQLFNTFPIPSKFRREAEDKIRALEEEIVLELHHGVASAVEYPKAAGGVQ